MMTKEGSTKSVNFMISGTGVLVLGHGDISHIVKMHYIFKKSSSLLLGIDKTNQVCSNDDRGRVYQNFKFHDPWDRGSCARAL